MDKFILLNEADKKAYYNAAADEIKVTPQLIEKDFWVCWILKILFSLPESGRYLTFKGGTSLSKCYKIIKRFSEDVDVSIERPFLAGTELIEPDIKQSNKENQRRLDKLKQLCQKKISDVIMPELLSGIEPVLKNPGKWELKQDADDPDKQTLLFAYPGSLNSDGGKYIKPVVKIELGARSDHWPVENMPVKPYVSDVHGKMAVDGTPVRVLGAERTFWEKATILHAISNGSKLRLRMSRHYYDVAEMIDSPVYGKAIQNIDLLEKVAGHKALFFKDSKARYDLAKRGSLRLIPQKEQIRQLEEDYRQMQEMFFEEPPSLKIILEKLSIAEEQINN